MVSPFETSASFTLEPQRTTSPSPESLLKPYGTLGDSARPAVESTNGSTRELENTLTNIVHEFLGDTSRVLRERQFYVISGSQSDREVLLNAHRAESN